MVNIANIIVILLSCTGFLLANYIRTTKKAPGTLVCPMEGSCEEVVTSQFSKIMGVPVEIMGMAYYSLTFLVYLSFLISPTLLPEVSSYIMLGVGATAFLFSIYLTIVQSALLKHWCTWCLCSAAISTIIFLIVLYVSNHKAVELLETLFGRFYLF
jgi:uncharacterized membrane protein